MSYIPSFGLADNDLIEFFRSPIEEISTSRLEGNRVFEAKIRSKLSAISITSSIFEIGERDEIGVISLYGSDDGLLENNIIMKDEMRNIISVHKIIGEIDFGLDCECGLLIEFLGGVMSFVSGSFPASLNVMCSGFDQGLQVSNFQKFKYSTKNLVIY